MVRTEHETGLDEFSIEGNVLKRNGQNVADFPTPICELARVDTKLLVVLHPYPENDNPEYAGTNLWALDLSGCILWKAANLNAIVTSFGPKSYDRIRIFEKDGIKLLAGTTDDNVNPVIDVKTGKEVGILGSHWKEEEIKSHIITDAIHYVAIVPGSPPKNGKLGSPHL